MSRLDNYTSIRHTVIAIYFQGDISIEKKGVSVLSLDLNQLSFELDARNTAAFGKAANMPSAWCQVRVTHFRILC